MAFTGDEGSLIDPTTAQKWIDNYKGGIGPNGVRAEFVGFRRLNELMSQENAIGIRVYYGKDDAGESKLVMVAVTPDEKNIARIDGSKMDGKVMDNFKPCPPYCNAD